MTNEEAQSIIENECFVNLIAAAKDNAELQRKIMIALRSDDITRIEIITSWVNSCVNNKAPREFTEALSYLTHREIANEAIKFLSC